MAIDTASKRFSAIHHGNPCRGIAYLPSGTVDGAARLALRYLYSGIAAASPGGFQAAWAATANVLLFP